MIARLSRARRARRRARRPPRRPSRGAPRRRRARRLRRAPALAATPRLACAAARRARATPVAAPSRAQRARRLARGRPGTGPGGRIVRADVRARPPATACAPGCAGARRRGAWTRDRADVDAADDRAAHGRVAGARSPSSRSRRRSTWRPRHALREELARRGRDPLPSFNDLVVQRCRARAPRVPGAERRVRRTARCVRYARVNVGVAVATDDALFVPTIFDADREVGRSRSPPSRAVWPRRCARGRSRSDELDGGTFTVSNLGMFGVRRFNAVINRPQAAILAVGEVALRPWVTPTAGSSRGRLMDVALSCDHRVVYGADGRAVPAAAARAAREPRAARLDRRRSDRAEIEFRQAIRDALDEELARDERVIFFGEDVAIAGGVFAATPGLYEKYGPSRVFDTPISELAMTGAAYGAAVTGLRPVLEIMFGDFLALSMDSLINQATKYHFLTEGAYGVPLVIRSVVGAGGRFGAIHSQMPVSWLMGITGLKIVAPSTPGGREGAAARRRSATTTRSSSSSTSASTRSRA